jgi:hypothetical protein
MTKGEESRKRAQKDGGEDCQPFGWLKNLRQSEARSGGEELNNEPEGIRPRDLALLRVDHGFGEVAEGREEEEGRGEGR